MLSASQKRQFKNSGVIYLTFLLHIQHMAFVIWHNTSFKTTLEKTCKTGSRLKIEFLNAPSVYFKSATY